MRTVLADVCVLLWVALSVAYGLTQTFWGVFAVTFVPSLPVAIIGLVTYPMTLLVLLLSIFQRRRSWVRLTY